MKFIVPVYIFSLFDNNESVEKLIFKWYHWARRYVICLPILYFVMKKGIIGYGEIASSLVLNTVILLFGFYYCNWNKRTGFLLFLINFVFLFFFGSRMPMVAVCIVGMYVFVIWKRIFGKGILITAFIAAITMFVINLKTVFAFLYDFCISMGIESRTIAKFTQDLGRISLLDMMGSSGRSYIWEVSGQFLKKQLGMPGGFAVIRALTDGRIYFSHNIFLDLSIMFGIFVIPLIIAVVYQLYKKYYLFSRTNFVFCTMCGLYFFLCSLTGAYFLGDSYAIVFWGMLFFLEVKSSG